MTELFCSQRYFGCVSIVGCKGIASKEDELKRFETVIDRNQMLCEPIVFTKIEDKNAFYLDLKRLHLEYLLALGIKRGPLVNKLINEIKASPE